ncbi:uncharacterized protein IWZ02DRAFT_121353 [Phyllosticta citriasiana]|uniref:uncharacterized protein n=1 Tax=Phyllosticta citriasiana TaxID=595635 RepID=UPI0030FD3B64
MNRSAHSLACSWRQTLTKQQRQQQRRRQSQKTKQQRCSKDLWQWQQPKRRTTPYHKVPRRQRGDKENGKREYGGNALMIEKAKSNQVFLYESKTREEGRRVVVAPDHTNKGRCKKSQFRSSRSEASRQRSASRTANFWKCVAQALSRERSAMAMPAWWATKTDVRSYAGAWLGLGVVNFINLGCAPLGAAQSCGVREKPLCKAWSLWFS